MDFYRHQSPRKLTMLWKILIVLLLIMEICGYVRSAGTCLAEMIACTREMTNDIAASTNTTTSLCGILERYMDCIEYYCSDALSQCDLNKARRVLAELLTDFSFLCARYIPRYGDDCSLPVPGSSSAAPLLCASPLLFGYYILKLAL